MTCKYDKYAREHAPQKNKQNKKQKFSSEFQTMPTTFTETHRSIFKEEGGDVIKAHGTRKGSDRNEEPWGAAASGMTASN